RRSAPRSANRFRTACLRQLRPSAGSNCRALWINSSRLVVRREDAQQASYAFRHALVQDAAYQSLLRSTRVQLHARIAGVLEERFPEAAETEPEFLAHHCTQANLVDKAIGYRLRAGMRAIERSGAVEAASQLEKGLELMPGTPTGPKRDEQ